MEYRDICKNDRIRVTHEDGTIIEGVADARSGNMSLWYTKSHVLLAASGSSETYELLERAPMTEPSEYGSMVEIDDPHGIEGRVIAYRLNRSYFEWVVLFSKEELPGTMVKYKTTNLKWNGYTWGRILDFNPSPFEGPVSVGR